MMLGIPSFNPKSLGGGGEVVIANSHGFGNKYKS